MRLRSPRSRRRRLGRLLVLGLGAAVAAAAQAQSLRCNGHIVQPGDPAIDVRHYCGPPSFVDRWAGGGAPVLAGVSSMQEWTYNHGPGRLLQIIVFKNGRVETVRTDGYGFVPNRQAQACRPDAIVPGMSKYRLLQRCGRPDQQTAGFVYSSRFSSGGYDFYLRRGVFPVYRERWIYNFGANRLEREVTLENAIVVATRALGRGFNN